MFRQVQHAQYGPIDIPGFPFKFSESEGNLRMPAPGLGEHTRMILEQRLGYSPSEAEELFKDKVVL